MPTDVSVRRGGPVVPADQLTSADQTSIVGDGTAQNPLHAAPGSGSVEIEDDGDSLGLFGTLDFAGAGVTATDAGGGRALVTIPGTGTEQEFRYVVTGIEGNPFPIALPAERASANYNVQLTVGGPLANTFKAYRPLVATFATTTFDCECVVPPQAGDILMLEVKDLT